MKDHPRSRGVYATGPRSEALAAGSSPLARGLLPDHAVDDGVGRIIPARAGFTGCTTGRPTARRDHPRSRGVYIPPRTTGLCEIGSSPLARGLPSPPRSRTPRRRIIPARAGFTTRASGRGPAPPDHPRSRGVYAPRVAALHRHQGSSPLARGLRDVGDDRWGAAGIIPARAGFTIPNVGASTIIPGSSPLARGLREMTVRSVMSRMDHPRSRGVYDPPFAVSPARRGSSPLARGLRSAPEHRKAFPGIIPARAGFTATLCTDLRSKRGSSPLARGLHVRHAELHDRRGIIPARAGFTPGPL